MKTSALLFMMAVPFISFAQAKIKFDDAKKNFGFVKKGEKVNLTYQFTNEGNQPLIISEAKAECSCTSVSWTKEPVAPGQKGSVLVVFDTAPTYDRQDRIVEVFSNDPKSPNKIRFKGVVLNK
jgi:hypothetical protein